MSYPDDPETKRGGGRTIVVAIIALLIAGIAAWALFVRPKAPETVATTLPALPGPSASPSSIPAAPTTAQISAAMHAAFPEGPALTDKDGARYHFDPGKLVTAPFGPVLVSEGKAADAAHVTAGRLDIFYLTPAGDGFAVAKRFPAAVQAGSFGQMSAWSVSDAYADLPVVTAEGGFTGQGYSCAFTTLTELQANGPAALGSIQTLYDDSGAVEANSRSYEGKIADIVKGQGFTVHYTGSKTFDEHYRLTDGKYVRQEKQSQLPEC